MTLINTGSGFDHRLVLANAQVLDVEAGTYTEGTVVAEGGRIVQVDGSAPAGGSDAEVVDVAGAFVLPGLIDCHVHVTAATAALAELRTWSPSYVAAHAARSMRAMLGRGFTTVRDVGGADFGLARAQREGLIAGPRLLFGGKALSQTGGHGDDRGPGATAYDGHTCCSGLGQVADGVDEVRRAARNVLRTGAHHIKVMASGGVASPTDRVDSFGYSMDELRAAVEEAESANRYVAAHAYTAPAIRRALEAGIRTIEHGNLIDEETIKLVTEKQAFVVMNLVTYWALTQEGREHGLSQESYDKVADVLDAGYRALEMADRAGLPVPYGTDLLGGMQHHQNREFEIRGEMQKPLAVVRAATSVAARLARMEGEIGCVAPGAHADLLVVENDPLEDIGVLGRPERFCHVIQGGRLTQPWAF